jgi:hypothetical protein
MHGRFGVYAYFYGFSFSIRICQRIYLSIAAG